MFVTSLVLHLLACSLTHCLLSSTTPHTTLSSVVSVGGDGMLSEVMHGLLTRSLRERGLSQPDPDEPLPSPSLRIGIIPAGKIWLK